MIYMCNSCLDISFASSCSKCVEQDQLHDNVPLNPAFYNEFQYESKGVINDLFFKKNKTKLLGAVLNIVLEKYEDLKHPYFTNFTYISSHIDSDNSDDPYNLDDPYNSDNPSEPYDLSDIDASGNSINESSNWLIKSIV